MASDLNISGLSDLNAALQQFTAKLEQNILRGALRAGQKKILEAAKFGIHSIDGDLADSLRISVRVKDGRVVASLKAGNKKAFYAHFVEFGTQAHTIKAKNGGALVFGNKDYASLHHPGAKAKPFMRPAMDGHAQEAVEATADYISKRITKELINQNSES
ncbi:HK97-gp10 family putative phage morphogenesis protein [Undibacterium sp. Ji50W]|uniref:HK97-gp10 family putative phage morphogenesis protein n=1 Tax=Undibacterium sp. Ji50W TaxID=3413041 RepID=UPI003BF3D1EC